MSGVDVNVEWVKGMFSIQCVRKNTLQYRDSGYTKPRARPCTCPFSAGVPLPPRKSRRFLWSMRLKPAKPPQKSHPPIPHTHSHWLSGSSVWVNSAPLDIPTVREIRGCHLTWFWLCGIAKDSRGAVRLSTIFVLLFPVSAMSSFTPMFCKMFCQATANAGTLKYEGLFFLSLA